jgi:hypothetical protein
MAMACPIWDRVKVVKSMVCQSGRAVCQTQYPIPKDTKPVQGKGSEPTKAIHKE